MIMNVFIKELVFGVVSVSWVILAGIDILLQSSRHVSANNRDILQT